MNNQEKKHNTENHKGEFKDCEVCFKEIWGPDPKGPAVIGYKTGGKW